MAAPPVIGVPETAVNNGVGPASGPEKIEQTAMPPLPSMPSTFTIKGLSVPASPRLVAGILI